MSDNTGPAFPLPRPSAAPGLRQTADLGSLVCETGL